MGWSLMLPSGPALRIQFLTAPSKLYIKPDHGMGQNDGLVSMSRGVIYMLALERYLARPNYLPVQFLVCELKI